MEHPTGQFATATGAMADAIDRLRALPKWNEWISFNAQGAGEQEDSYHFGEIRVLRDLIDPGVPIDIEMIASTAHVETSRITRRDDGIYRLSHTTSLDVAQILDAIFRKTLDIRPFEDEDDDYAIGAEW